jgi:hypothetical protein
MSKLRVEAGHPRCNEREKDFSDFTYQNRFGHMKILLRDAGVDVVAGWSHDTTFHRVIGRRLRDIAGYEVVLCEVVRSSPVVVVVRCVLLSEVAGYLVIQTRFPPPDWRETRILSYSSSS